MVQRLEVGANTVKIIGDNSFGGTGFFITREYCVTCHHVICGMNKIRIDHNRSIYDAEWIGDYSMMDNDIAILKVKDIDVTPLECAKEPTPRIAVSIWGFTKATRDSLPAGREIPGDILSTTVYEDSEKPINGINPWNKKPRVNVMVYQISCNNAGVGLSGSPVYESNRGKIVGMFAAAQGEDPYRDLTREGYMIPIDVILRFQDIKVITSSADINIAELLDEGKKYYYAADYSKAIECYDKITNYPTFYEAWFNKGLAYGNLGNHKKAIECFDLATRINPDLKDNESDKRNTGGIDTN